MRAHPFHLRPAAWTGNVVRKAERPAPQTPVVIAEWLGGLASAALTAELETWPKPGLVSHIDTGSHDDMDHATFQRSAAALRPYFGRLAQAGGEGADMDRLRRIGREAEAAMLDATGGVNTHRGAIFGVGLLCAAAGAAWAEWRPVQGVRPRLHAGTLTDIVRQRWGEAIVSGPIPLHSHGSGALRRFGAGGARMEAAAGFPHARRVGLPALRLGRALAGGEEAARVQAFFSLLAVVEDTNLLHRGGAAGLQDAREAARRFLADGGIGQSDWVVQAAAVHRDFVRRRLSPGGCADLLAATVFLDLVEGGP